MRLITAVRLSGSIQNMAVEQGLGDQQQADLFTHHHIEATRTRSTQNLTQRPICERDVPPAVAAPVMRRRFPPLAFGMLGAGSLGLRLCNRRHSRSRA